MPVICLNNWEALGPAIVLVQQKTATAADASSPAGVTATFDTPLTADNGVIAVVSWVSTVAGLDLSPTLVGGGAGTLGLEADGQGTTIAVQIYSLIPVAGGETAVTFSLDGAVRASICVIEVSGLAGGSAEDANNNAALASTTVATNSVTPSSASNFVVGAGAWTANNYSSGPTNSFTRLTPTGGGAAFQEAAYLIQSSATAKSTGWGLTVGINWAACIAVFSGA